MKRLFSSILLATYGFVSILGHAGLDVVGLHSHHHAHSFDYGEFTTISETLTGDVSEHSCNHHHACGNGHSHRHHSPDHDHNHSHDPFDSSNGCVVCAFSVQTQYFEVVLPPVGTFTSIQHSVDVEQQVFSSNVSQRPTSRGPPAALT